MKTTISIPDDLFEKAERLARRLNTSRSRLYAQAVKQFIARHDEDRVMSTMDRALDEVGEPTDPFIHETARRSLERVEW